MRQPADIESPDAGSDRAQRTGLVTMLFTDMVGSTALKQQLGDRAAAELFRRHHEVIRETLKHFPQGEEVETAGDSFLITFGTPSDAVEFALVAQARLRRLREGGGSSDRMGIHVGEVVVGHDTQSRKPTDLFGIAIDTCSRVMSLAKAGQTLMTRTVFDSARQVLKGEDMPEAGSLEWLNHGPYLLKGLEEAVEICEVREAGQVARGPPPNSEKAQRKVSADEESVLGWRPAVSQTIPNTRWVLEQKLGEGGFGEVWLGRNSTTKQQRVFKFCFQAERVRFLKREMTLFRVLKERVGDHPNIVRLNDVYLDRPPFYVEMEYVEGADLRSWCEKQGGMEAIPLETRLEIIAQAAEGLQAAHEAGIIHRDIKPANILIGNKKSETGNQKFEVKLTDFGIGQVMSEESLQGITRAGFTQTILSDSSLSRTGTQLYMAPELSAGKPASTRSDIYSLGVVLYQLLVGDFTQPVTGDWANGIQDPLLREDLQQCLAGKPQDRFSGADQVAKHLRALPERRAQLARREVEKVALARTAYRRGMMRTAGVAGAIVVAIAGLAIVAFNQSRRAKAAAQAEKQQRTFAERNLYAANMSLAQQAWEQNDLKRLRELLEETANYPGRGFEWYYWQRQIHLDLMTLKGHSDMVSCAAFSPDGQRIVTGSWDTTAKVWEAVSGKELLTLKGHSAKIGSVAFSSDGRRIITGSDDNRAIVWDAASGKVLLTLKGHRAQIVSAAFSLDGRRIVTSSWDTTAKVWEAVSGKELLTLRGHSVAVLSASFSRDSQRIVTGSWDTTAKVWEAASGKELLTLKGHRAPIQSVAFSPDGLRIVTGGGDQTAKVWEALSGKELLTLKGHSGEVSCVAFSADGQRIVTGSADQTAKVWEAASGKELLILKGHSGAVSCASFSSDGQQIVTSSDDQTAKLWEAVIGKGLLAISRHNAPIRSVAFSPDGQRIVSGGDDQTANVWETESGKELVTLEGHRAPIRSVAFSPDGRRIVTGSVDQTAKVCEAASGKELLTLKGHRGGIWCLAFSPDGQRVATGSQDERAKVWDAASGKELLTLEGHRGAIWCVAFSPDGQWIATGSQDATAKVWETASGKQRLTLTGHRDAINSAAFSPDGQWLVTGSNDRTAKVWDVVRGKELLTLKGHRGAINSAAFSPDGQRVLTGSADGVTKVWEAASGKELLSLEGHSAGISCVAFSPDGHKVVTGRADGTTRMWQTATSQQVTAWQREENAASERLSAFRREQAVAVERERVLRAQDPGAIKQWLVLAPIPFASRTHEGALEALDQEQVGHETELRVRAGEPAKVSASELTWSAVRLEDYLIDFNLLQREETPWSVAYAVCYIQSQATQAGLLMKVGSDDEAKIFLNGKAIYRHDSVRGCLPEQDVIEGVELKAGLNVLVSKVVNETGGWQGSVRFTDAAGQPVKGISVTLDPSKQ